MQNRQPVIIPDIYADSRIPHVAYRPTFVKSLAMVPIRTIDPVGAIGNYWATSRVPTSMELTLLQGLADSTSVAMENVRVYQELEERVRERTKALVAANREIRKLSMTDDLTGLYNRRGFYTQAQRALRKHNRIAVASVDLDGLKRVNDNYGHQRGSELIATVATILRKSFRSTDIIGRLGGDEFCVLVPDPQVSCDTLRGAFQSRLSEINRRSSSERLALSASIGVVESVASDLPGLEGLMARADALMYEEKRSKKSPPERVLVA